jgi:hypothetical protein
MQQLQTINADLARSRSLPAYEAVDVAWVAVIKVANLLSGDSEHRRLLALLDQLPENRIRPILQHKGVDALLNLDPPLESVFSAASYERLDSARTARELSAIREKRENAPNNYNNRHK